MRPAAGASREGSAAASSADEESLLVEAHTHVLERYQTADQESRAHNYYDREHHLADYETVP